MVQLTEPAISKANEVGLGLAHGFLCEQRATALMSSAEGSRADNLEEAIVLFDLALQVAENPEHAAQRAMHLALAWAERVKGDRAENLEEAVRLLRTALGELDDSCAPETWAIMRTNLAMVLTRRERGDRGENLEEAADLCRGALEFRSPDRDGYDWAHTQLNLGEILEQLSRLRKTSWAEAELCYREVIDHAEAVREKWLIGDAHASLGRMYWRAGKRSSEEVVAAIAEDEDADVSDAIVLLEQAREELEAARVLLHGSTDPVRLARALDDLAGVLSHLDRTPDSIAVGREAISILTPVSAPRECLSAAGRLGHQLATAQEFADASIAFRSAVEAAELVFHARLDTEAREKESETAGNLARWASFAIAAVDDAVEAALVLESGRARELRRRLGFETADAGRVLDLPDEYRNAYLLAADQLSSASLGPSGAEAARTFEEVLAEIRGVPGFEDFGIGAREQDLIAAVEEGWPLIYVNPTPYGTALIRFWLDGEEVAAASDLVEHPTSIEVLFRLMTGTGLESSALSESEDPPSYLLGVAATEHRDLRRDLESILPWLGEAIAKPIHDCAAEVGAAGVTLVPCGPIGAAPIHAAPWTTPDGELCLLDAYDVRYAPSATMAAASLERADETGSRDPSLVAVANPTSDLAAAGPEVEEVSRHFPPGQVSVAREQDGTSEFLRSQASNATYLHLACHARGGLLDPGLTGVALADGFLSSPEITTMGPLETRLTVVSACQTASASISHLPNEVLATSTAMLAAGSACAVASLWAVDDVATALLMTRMYEEMFDHGQRPPEALRAAQLWLRGLSVADEQVFLSHHPALADEFQRRADQEAVPGRRGEGSGSSIAGVTPYAHPHYWAPFIAVGA